MKLFIIHCVGDEIRHNNILKQFESQTTKYDYEIVPAIMNPSQFSVGLMRSFKKSIQKAKENYYPEILILEDDFNCLCNHSIKMLINTWNDMIDQNGILLGSCYEGEIKQLSDKYGVIEGKLAGLNSVIIPASLYDIILDAEEPYHLDFWISMISKIPVYVAHPFLIVQLDGIFSYNQKEITNYTQSLHLKYKMIGK